MSVNNRENKRSKQRRRRERAIPTGTPIGQLIPTDVLDKLQAVGKKRRARK